MANITVGHISGLIAFGTFISNRSRSVVGKALQGSWWPRILGSESTDSKPLPQKVNLVTKLTPISLILIAVTGTVTPMGLYDALVPGTGVEMPFKYAQDSSPFGYGTPARSNLGFNRKCGSSSLVACPGSSSVEGRISSRDTSLGYNITIPEEISELYSSGTGGRGTTISNIFDIQWRQYSIQQSPDYNNGSQYLTGVYRQLNSLILDNSVALIDGLVVDTSKAQIGLRSHTLPTGFQNRASWSEDLLFFVPETQCVGNNISIDYTVAAMPNSEGPESIDIAAVDVTLRDHNGLADLPTEYPEGYWGDDQADPTLRARASKAAWIMNTYTMIYMNRTKSSKPRSGEELSLFKYAKLRDLQGIQTSDNFDFMTNSSQFKTIGKNVTQYDNPEGITSKDFLTASTLCSGAGGQDKANITNVAISCGLVFGAAQRTDGVKSTVFEQGTRWSIPLHTCATAVKAVIKTVEFEADSPDLRDSRVRNITDKVYTDHNTLPTWGVEHLNMNLSDVQPIWGLVSPSASKTAKNVSTIQQPHLYLPGDDSLSGVTLPPDNLPGTAFHTFALKRAYSVGSSITNSDMADYSGRTNVALFTMFQRLSESPTTTSHMINLLFADITANAIVGTRSVLGSPSDKNYTPAAEDDSMKIVATPLLRRVKFKYLYGIPAYILLALWAVVNLMTLVFAVSKRVSFARVRYFLARSSAGRILATTVYPEYADLDTDKTVWGESVGSRVIDLSGPFPKGEEEEEQEEQEGEEGCRSPISINQSNFCS
ncbi:hypothetical protein BDV26DRAFT_278245 [Aspergillus bertholletiae]|uniref:Uncharacterized protein n=1 Tax=Aspergillus bertholletiae TaxID=1226010 RepID=A0A5N7BKG9_9EURO|nr:hypothetical protein BDV26DRAFT_278245 [Aspergillus bertholletiae]